MLSLFKLANCLKCNSEIYRFNRITPTWPAEAYADVEVECCDGPFIISVPRIYVRRLS